VVQGIEGERRPHDALPRNTASAGIHGVRSCCTFSSGSTGTSHPAFPAGAASNAAATPPAGMAAF
jgi:hypothetical protein